MKNIAIVGSGPSGAIAAKYLVGSGHHVDLYDVGLEYDGKREIRTNNNLVKLYKKSDFMYRVKDEYVLSFDSNSAFFTSHAKGGLSNVWGATVSSISKSDALAWGGLRDDLCKNLSEVFSIMGVVSDLNYLDISDKLTYENESINFLNCQTQYIYENSIVHSQQLEKCGIYISKSKLAINLSRKRGDRDCVLCNKCMSGCDYDSIFNSKFLIESLLSSDNFQYKQNCLIKSVIEGGDHASLVYKNLINGEIINSNSYDHVLLGAGCIETLKILANSELVDLDNVEVLESQKYYFPIVCKKKYDGSGTISLSHLYVQSFDKYKNAIHMQVYPGMPHLHDFIRLKFGFFSEPIIWLLRPILNRILIGCVYLNSNVSGKLKVELSKNFMSFTTLPNKESDSIFKNFISALNKHSEVLGIFIPPLKLKSKIGHSQHFGGTFPLVMSEKIHSNSTNSEGRIYGTKNIYLIDSSSMPNIPATPTTGLVCANALRIAKIISSKGQKNE